MSESSKIKSTNPYVITSNDINWLYPPSDLYHVLANTNYPYQLLNDNIIECPDIISLSGIHTEIYYQTVESYNHTGYSVGKSTKLEVMKNELYFQLSGGKIISKWILVHQLNKSEEGTSPKGMIGYIPIFSKFSDYFSNHMEKPFLYTEL
jgi:hypothetical protein